jgi:hypothetical protein
MRAIVRERDRPASGRGRGESTHPTQQLWKRADDNQERTPHAQRPLESQHQFGTPRWSRMHTFATLGGHRQSLSDAAAQALPFHWMELAHRGPHFRDGAYIHLRAPSALHRKRGTSRDGRAVSRDTGPMCTMVVHTPDCVWLR